MITITIPAEEHVYNEPKKVAHQSEKAVEDLVLEAIYQYLQIKPLPQKTYSFIGIGHSGKSDLSTQVKEILAEAA